MENFVAIEVGTDIATVTAQRPNEYLKQKREETEMAIETMLLDRNLSAEAGMNVEGANPKGDPGPGTDDGTKSKACPSRARNLCHQFASFFRIGHHYDWEEQHKEYSQYWKNHFQARHPE